MNLKLRNSLSNLSDRLQHHVAGKALLGLCGTFAARIITKRSVKISHVDGIWFRSDNGTHIPLGNRLRLSRGMLQSWKPSGEEMSSMRRIWWFRYDTPQANDIIIDVGAGRGEDTLVFSKVVGSMGKVIAIEAHPKTFHILKSFIALNKLDNVQAYQLAASDCSGTCPMSDSDDEGWQCSSIVTAQSSEILVPSGKLDDISEIQCASRIAFLKMNIEGAEVTALLGAHETLAKTKAVCICCHDFLGEKTQTKKQVSELLINADFNLTPGPIDGEPYERDFIYGHK